MKLQTTHTEHVNKADGIRYIIRFKDVETDVNVVYRKLHARIMHATPHKVSRFWRCSTIAVSIALLFASSLWFYTHHSSSPSLSLEVVALAGQKVNFTLPDGTEVWLNEHSHLRYPETFSPKRRQVELVGEGCFEVAKERNRPFQLHLDGMRVQVLGTRFHVLAPSQGETIETSLLSGSIALYKRENMSNTPDRILIPGEQAVYNKKKMELEVHTLPTAWQPSWLTGEFVFDEVTFGQIIDLLERSFGVTFYLNDNGLRNIKLIASFTNGESLEEILSILQITMKYRYRMEEKRVYIE